MKWTDDFDAAYDMENKYRNKLITVTVYPQISITLNPTFILFTILSEISETSLMFYAQKKGEKKKKKKASSQLTEIQALFWVRLPSKFPCL